MKAKNRINWSDPSNRELRARIVSEFKTLFDAHRYETEDLFFAAAYIAANKAFGAGKKRLQRFETVFKETLKMCSRNYTDEADELTFRELERLGMTDLIADMKIARTEMHNAIKGSFLDLGK